MSDKLDLDGMRAKLDGIEERCRLAIDDTEFAFTFRHMRFVLTAYRELEREVRAVNRAIESAEFDIADDHDPYSSGMRRVVELVREAMGWPREDDR